MYTPKRDTMTQEEKEYVQTRVAVRGKAAETKSISRSKSRYSKSPSKAVIKMVKNNEVD